MDPTILYILALLIAALLLILFELVTPSFGLLTIFGLLAAGGAVWLAFSISRTLGYVLLVALVLGLPAYYILLIRWIPRTRLGQRFFLKPRGDRMKATGTPEAEHTDSMVGRTGTAETYLRPSGAVRIDGQRVIAVAERGLIEKGATVRVTGRTTSGGLVVRSVDPN